MRHRVSAFLLAVALAAGVSPARALERVRALETLPGSVRFEVAVPPPVVTAGPPPSVAIDGYSPSETPGQPTLPVRTVTVAVPPTGDVTVHAIGTNDWVREGVEVALVPATDVAPVAASGAAIARLVEVGWMRHQRIARIAISPARWDRAARRLLVYGRVEVTVDVAPTPVAAATPEADAFEDVYRDALVNYDQGRAWRSRPGSAAAAGGRRLSLAASDMAAATTVPDTSVFNGHKWVKIAVRKSGFYKIPYTQFRSLVPFSNDTTIVSDSLRLFTWPGYPVLPETSYCDTCGFREVALGIVDDDGRMNHTGDAIYFYALGPNDWADRYDPRLPDTVFVNHPYETRNYYYLSFGKSGEPFTVPSWQPPRRIATRTVSPATGATPASFPSRAHFENDASYEANINPGSSSYVWDKWFWTKLEPGNTFATFADAPGADTTQGARLRARVWNAFDQVYCFQPRAFTQVTWNGTVAGPGTFSWTGFTGYTIDTHVDGLQVRNNALRLTATNLTCDNYLAVSWFDLFYPRRYVPSGEKLDFRPPSGGGAFGYHVGPFAAPATAPPRLFDVSDAFTPVELVGQDFTDATGGRVLSFQSTDDDGRRYTVLPDSAFAAALSGDVATAAATSVDNLRSRNQQADYVVIYYDAFKEAADSLTTWRRAHNIATWRGPLEPFRTKIVPISAIYDQFSGGRTDPTAIRNFLRAAYYNWGTQPTYVTFLGDPSYDFKDLLGRALPGQPGCPLPTYENGYEDFSFRQFTTDDWLMNVDNPKVVLADFLGGRLPARDAANALGMVRDKVLRYERSAPFGAYRDRVMLIGDDNQQGNLDDPLHWTHVVQTTTLDTVYTPTFVDRDYVYLHLFPSTNSFTKPDARDSIVYGIDDEGTALVNFVGHGSPFKLADENVLLASDADALTNADRLPLFVTASCDVGRLSDPINDSLGERLVRNTVGGAVGVISATDLAYSGQNAPLNQAIFRELFSRQPDGSLSGWAAKAVAAAKTAAIGSTNAQKFQLMADAAMRMNLPRYWVDLTLENESGADTTSIQQGRRMSFRGQVRQGPGGTPVALDGQADVLVEDAPQHLRTPRCSLPGSFCPDTAFLYKAAPIFRGQANVSGGVLSGRFVVPLEARPGVRSRIRAYLTGTALGQGETDGVGDLQLAVVPGTAQGTDTHGPDIRLSFANNATTVRPNALLRIDLADSSGILITGHTPQNGIVVTIDGNTTSRVNVANSFRYGVDSYQSGRATFQLPNLSDGPHVVTVSAADNLAVGLTAAQHRSEATLRFLVGAALPLQLVDAYLFPDPTHSRGSYSGGNFVVDTDGGQVDAQIRIFSVSGRLLRVLKATGEGQLQVPWDGQDAEGQSLANGVYLFRVVLHSQDSTDASGNGQSARADGRFVIVNP